MEYFFFEPKEYYFYILISTKLVIGIKSEILDQYKLWYPYLAFPTKLLY